LNIFFVISAKEKEFPSSKDPPRIRYIFIVPCVQENVYESSTLLCIAFLCRTFVERKRFPIFPRFLDPFLFLNTMSKDPKL
jgi:hypothetical protein